ncbi:DUF1028 domain-containing protein [Actinospica sp. MGRD01-02]|uniref:DUF1028 domain-containing protein n=1 Tax=Actinospica acidithermotolerans TaxID=2828514 RepID=A0A941EJD1_9ACTN|nr:DUF1028 domain-containing protein [Actinospica acidithermotolerans]MBR7831468.1 DUF1028 domain-containing protein [Actinospica acidithermotolerans]
MTFSIVAANADRSEFGVAVASKFLAAGSVVPAARAGVGAIATQAWANTAYKSDGLALLTNGANAQEMVDTLTKLDGQREQRQIGVVDAHGTSATYTGKECTDWAGGVAGDGYAIQGNILEGSRVIALMEEAWLGSDPREPLARRLLEALAAGDRAGGDKRGRQSAALFVVGDEGGYGGGDDVIVDLRVDDHPTPIPELARLLTIHELLFGKPNPADLMPLSGPLAEEVRSLLGAQGYIAGDVTTAELDRVLATWAGVENLEERLVPGRLDPVLLDHLRRLSKAEADA